MKKQLAFVDMAKFGFAIGVVLIHSGCLAGSDMPSWLIMHGILKLAVPFFFCAAGFFLYESLQKTQETDQAVKKYLKRLLIPLCFWLTLNLPVVVFGYLKDGNGISEILLKLGRDLIFYPWGAMWFVSALIVATLLIMPFYKKNRLQYTVILGLLLYLIGLVFNNYYFVVQGTALQRPIDSILGFAGSMRNGIFEGMFFVAIGMYISKLREEHRYSRKTVSLLLLISYVLLLAEIILIKNLPHRDDDSLFIMFIMVIPCLLLFLSDLPFIKHNTKLFRNYSTGIYFSHRFILAIVMFLLKPYNSWLGFTITLTVAITVLGILYKIDNDKINLVIK